MEKSKKKFSIYTTRSEYDPKTRTSNTIYTLESETDDVNEVDSLYAKTFTKEVFDIKTYAPKFESYYTRCALYTTEDCEDDLHYWYDFGSHSRFIELHFIDRSALKEYEDLRVKKQKEYEND